MDSGFKRGDLVAYVAPHVQNMYDSGVSVEEGVINIVYDVNAGKRGMPNSLDGIELGIVSSTNDEFIFVKFYPQLTQFGWEGTTSKACYLWTIYARPAVRDDDPHIRMFQEV